MTKAILSTFFFCVSFGIAYYLFSSIKKEVDEQKDIDKVESGIIKSLQEIRSLQKLYYAVHAGYTSNWHALSAFYKSDSIRIVERKEEVIALDYGAERVEIHERVIGVISVQDSLQRLHPTMTPHYMMGQLEKNAEKFAMWAGKIERGGVKVDVVEVWDTKPVDKKRKESHPIRSQKPLRFGSQESVTLSGNWE